MITVIGLAGSPRRNGNSTTLLRSVLKGAESKGARIETLYLNDLLYKGCQGCKTCSPGGHCVVKDTLTPLFAALKLADIWILASPVYFDGLSGQMKTFFDRCRHFFYKDGIRGPQLLGKRRAVIILTYEANPSEYYLKVAKSQALYLKWMGDFGNIKIVSESKLSKADDASKRTDLLEMTEDIGGQLVVELQDFGPGGHGV
jgi:multimeric flavodoxin WrbA